MIQIVTWVVVGLSVLNLVLLAIVLKRLAFIKKDTTDLFARKYLGQNGKSEMKLGQVKRRWSTHL